VQNFDEVWRGKSHFFLLVRRVDGGAGAEQAHSVYVVLEPATDGPVWEVQSGGVFRPNYPAGKDRVLLWQSERANTASTDAGSAPLGAKDHSKGGIGTREGNRNGKTPPAEAGMVRFYHGGSPYEGGPRWLTEDQRYNQGYADKNANGDAFLHY
jgi:hypothetical protein